jgi:hypothetical protein
MQLSMAMRTKMVGGSTVKNSDWIFTEDVNFITGTLKVHRITSGFTFNPVGFTIPGKTDIPPNTKQNFTVTI